MYYMKACNELAKVIHVIAPWKHSFTEKLQRWLAATLFNLAGLRFKPPISRFGDECIAARPNVRLFKIIFHYYFK